MSIPFFFLSLVSVAVEECKRASAIVGALVLRNEHDAWLEHTIV